VVSYDGDSICKITVVSTFVELVDDLIVIRFLICVFDEHCSRIFVELLCATRGIYTILFWLAVLCCVVGFGIWWLPEIVLGTTNV